MGDRANIIVKEEQGGTVHLYSHWHGSDMPQLLQAALAKQDRWQDEQYLTRIIAHTMGEALSGISTTMGDGADAVLVVDVAKQQVQVQAGYTYLRKRRYTFAEFVADAKVGA